MAMECKYKTKFSLVQLWRSSKTHLYINRTVNVGALNMWGIHREEKIKKLGKKNMAKKKSDAISNKRPVKEIEQEEHTNILGMEF